MVQIDCLLVKQKTVHNKFYNIRLKMGLCRLCLTQSDQIVEIFGEEGRKQNISHILSEFFWFQIVENDAISTLVCQECWLNTSTFQVFHCRVKLAQMHFLKQTDHATNAQYQQQIQAKDEFDNIGIDELVDGVACKQEPSDNESDDDGVAESGTIAKRSESTRAKAEEKKRAKQPQRATKRSSQSTKSDNVPAKLINKVENDEDDSDDDEEEDDDADYTDDDRQNDDDNDNDGDGDGDGDDSDDDDDAPLVRKQTGRPKQKSTKFETDAKIRANCNLYCTICYDTFDTFLQLTKHYQFTHDCVGYVMCCERKIKVRSRLLEHIETHLNPDAFKCNVCNARLQGRFLLKKHMDTHMSVEDRPFACDGCPNRYTNAQLLASHRSNKHSREEDKTFLCTVCDRKYLTALKLEMHVKRTHDFVPEICDYCGKEFKSIANLTIHRERVHLADEKTRKQCNICGAWVSEHYFKRHLKQHNAVAQTCKVCGKTLQNKSTLTNHMRHVHGTRMHECSMCDKAFTKPMSLREHMAGHTGKDLYSCGYCPKTFKSDSNMYKHRRKCHAEEWARDREKRAKTGKSDL